MIAKLYYVRCDGCGAPCGGTADLAESTARARRNAVRIGWLHTANRDFCSSCRPVPSTPPDKES